MTYPRTWMRASPRRGSRGVSLLRRNCWTTPLPRSPAPVTTGYHRLPPVTNAVAVPALSLAPHGFVGCKDAERVPPSGVKGRSNYRIGRRFGSTGRWSRAPRKIKAEGPRDRDFLKAIAIYEAAEPRLPSFMARAARKNI
jgi:hypothetical protein